MAATRREQDNRIAAGALRRIEERVARIEEELQHLRAQLARDPAAEQPGWKQILGSQAGDPTFAAIVREMRRLRREDYAAARARSAKGRGERPGRSKQRAAQRETP